MTSRHEVTAQPKIIQRIVRMSNISADYYLVHAGRPAEPNSVPRPHNL